MTQEILLKDIVEDKEQPREYFNAAKLATLKSSISRHGIRNPLIVEKHGDKYLLQDGARRYRVATDLGLKKVPVVIAPATTEAERLVIQFHIQEQHEGWLPTEKAAALQKIADMMKIGVREACELIGATGGTADGYIAFSKLVEKRYFQQTEIPLVMAKPINGFKSFVRNLYTRELLQDFDPTLDRRIEKALIDRIKDGSIVNARDVAKLKDSVKKDPKSLEAFLKDRSITVDQMFTRTKAKGAFHARQVYNNSLYLAQNIKKFLEIGDVEVTEDTIKSLKQVKRDIDVLLKKVDTE